MDTWLRMVAYGLVGCATLYGGLLVLLYLLQERLIFFPLSLQQEPQGPHQRPVTVQRDAATLRGWVVNEHSSGPLLIYFGGNAEEVSGLVDTFSGLDAATVLINYRGYGGSDGKPRAADLIDDAAAIVRTMGRTIGEDRPLIVFGRSLGSGIAALATRVGGVDGLILLSPYRSIGHVAKRRFPIFPVRRLLRHDIDATLAIDGLPQRVLVLYARQDSVVPTKESLALVKMLKTRPQIVEFDGPHGIAIETPALWNAVKAFVGDLDNRAEHSPPDQGPIQATRPLILN